jgi:DNA (cytosine-5)-methyltransferase 1
MKLKVLDLFSGIGGFSLGLERATLEGAEYDGFETVAFCEIEAFPRKVLAKHWPSIPQYDDVRTLTAERLAADGIAVDVICGGFPCQDISLAGRKAGVGEGTRSGLYTEVLRLASDIRPKLIILENVANLLVGPSEKRGGWFGRILGDLASIGYDAEWENIPASALGASHRRERVWIVSYPTKERSRKVAPHPSNGIGRKVANDTRPICEALAKASRQRQQGPGQSIFAICAAESQNWKTAKSFASSVGNIWGSESKLGRVAHGLPNRSHRIAALGNAVVPQIPELIGNAILQSLKVET